MKLVELSKTLVNSLSTMLAVLSRILVSSLKKTLVVSLKMLGLGSQMTTTGKLSERLLELVFCLHSLETQRKLVN